VTRRSEPFTMLPNRFIDAEMRGELSQRQAKLCRFIARNASQNTREARLTLAQIAAGVGWERSEDTLMRELKALRPEWIDFGSKPGQRAPYLIRLTGLAVEQEGDSTSARPPQNPVNLAEVEPPHADGREAGANQRREPHATSAETSADAERSLFTLTSSEGRALKAASEEKLDHLVGETTAAEFAPADQSEPEFPPLLDALEPNPFHESAGLLTEEEIAQLGTASLDELHRPHERGEL
jgi:hypothetical protein